MNKFAIPAILVATVMVAGMFAFMPVEQASTVHTTLAASGVLQQTYSLDGLIDGTTLVLMDATIPGEISSVHLAMTLPSLNGNADANCDAGELPVADINILVGQAPSTLGDVADDTTVITNTGLEASAFDNNNDGDTLDPGELSCVYHATINSGDTVDSIVLPTITDVAIQVGVSGPLPDDASITITAEVAP